jgi:hypothetical protein
MVNNEFEKIVESRSLLKEDQIEDIQNKIDYLFWLEEEKKSSESCDIIRFFG